MPANVTAMAEVGRLERPVFTWNPIEQRWIQERGGDAKAPPMPHDLHAIQTWFLDLDENEWIQTVLGPMGRQLAQQWRGAYRVPDEAIAKTAKAAPRRRSPLPFAIGGVVILALIGGVAMAAPALMAPSAPAAVTPAQSNAPAPTVAPAPVETPAPTAAPTDAPVTPVPTARPAVRPSGPSVTLPNGSVVIYTGPTVATRGGTLPATFSVYLANGRPGAGQFAIILDRGDPANRRSVVGTLDANGRIAMQVPTNVISGTYTLSFSYSGSTNSIATVVVR
jgi:hypothetical protein